MNELARNSDVKGTSSCCPTQARPNGQEQHANCVNHSRKAQSSTTVLSSEVVGYHRRSAKGTRGGAGAGGCVVEVISS